MAELKISRTNCARSEIEIAARPTSAMVVRFFLEPKSFKIPPTKCQWGPIGHLYNLGWSMGSPWWPYGGRLSDPFSDFLPPTSATNNGSQNDPGPYIAWGNPGSSKRTNPNTQSRRRLQKPQLNQNWRNGINQNGKATPEIRGLLGRWISATSKFPELKQP